MANLQKGTHKNDLLAGLAYSIVQNYINRVVVGKHIGKNIFFLGGVAFNKAVVSAFERYLSKKISVPLHHEVAGAIGMALIAMRHMKNLNASSVKQNQPDNSLHITDYVSRTTCFKGFEVSKKQYARQVSTTRRGSSALNRVITCSVPVFVRVPISAGRIDG